MPPFEWYSGNGLLARFLLPRFPLPRLWQAAHKPLLIGLLTLVLPGWNDPAWGAETRFVVSAGPDCDAAGREAFSEEPQLESESLRRAHQTLVAARCALKAGDFATALQQYTRYIEALEVERYPQHRALYRYARFARIETQIRAGRLREAAEEISAWFAVDPALAPALHERLLAYILHATEKAPTPDRDGGLLLRAYLAHRPQAAFPEIFLRRLWHWEAQQVRPSRAAQRRVLRRLWQNPATVAEASAWGATLHELGPRFYPPGGDALHRHLRRLYRLEAYQQGLQTLNDARLNIESKLGLRRLAAWQLRLTLAQQRHQHTQAASQKSWADLIDSSTAAASTFRRRYALTAEEVDALAVEAALYVRHAAETTRRLAALSGKRNPARTSPALAGYYLRLARIDPPRRLYWWGYLLAQFPQSKAAQEAAWNLFWHHYRQGDYPRARTWIDGPWTQHSPEKHPQWLYWQGVLLENLGQKAQAAEQRARLRTRYPNSYYANVHRLPRVMPPSRSHWLGQDAITPTNGGTQAGLDLRARRGSQIPWLTLWMLHSSGTQDLAEIYAKEVLLPQAKHALTTRRAGGSPLRSGVSLPEALSAANVFGLHHLHFRLTIASRLGTLRRQPAHAAPPFSDAWPLAYGSIVLRESMRRGVDPFLVLAVMREESHFDPQAISTANARGLMQLLPSTAQDMARRDRTRRDRTRAARVSFHPLQLFIPERNIAYGTAYLGKMLQQFHGNVTHAVAAYNAGPSRVRRWRKKHPGSVPRAMWVELIPFAETRQYVKRVSRSYVLYRQLYAQQNAWLPPSQRFEARVELARNGMIPPPPEHDLHRRPTHAKTSMTELPFRSVLPWDAAAALLRPNFLGEPLGDPLEKRTAAAFFSLCLSETTPCAP